MSDMLLEAQLPIDRIIDNVYIGSRAQVANFIDREWDRQEKIAILSIGDFRNPRWYKKNKEDRSLITHRHFGGIDDYDDVGFSAVVGQIIRFIEEERKKNSKVIVHCLAGRNRSVASVMAWLVAKKNYSTAKALATVESRHPSASPTRDLYAAVKELE